MTFLTEFLDEGKGVLFTGSDILKPDEISAVKEEFFRFEDRTRQILYGLVDLNLVTGTSLTMDSIREFADIDKQLALLSPGALIAVIAPTDLLFGLSRMWEMMAAETQWNIHIFRSRTEAEDWLRGELAEQRQFYPTFTLDSPHAGASRE